jgi:hypothetical protein
MLNPSRTSIDIPISHPKKSGATEAPEVIAEKQVIGH